MKWIFSKRSVLVLGCSMAGIGYIFSIKLASIGMILFVVSWLINYGKLSLKNIFYNYYYYPLLLFFIFLLLSLTYSIDLAKGIDFLVRNIAYIIYPVVFSSIYFFSKKESFIILKVYCYTIAGVTFFCLCIAIYRQLSLVGSFKEINWYFFYGNDFFEIIDQHPTYVSMYSVLSISILFFNNNLYKKVEKNVLLSILIFGVLFSGSRIGYFAFIMILGIYVINQIVFNNRIFTMRSIIAPLLIGVVVLFTFVKIPIITERIYSTLGVKDFNYRFFHNREIVENGNSESQGRFLIWADAIEVIKERPFLGYGAGSNEAVLLKKYKEKEHFHLLEVKYNAHNTYLEILIIGGIPLLLAYLIILLSLFYRAYTTKDFIILSFALIISLTSLTETLFRAQGILFFLFFYCYLLKYKHE